MIQDFFYLHETAKRIAVFNPVNLTYFDRADKLIKIRIKLTAKLLAGLYTIVINGINEEELIRRVVVLP